jgi:NIMA (never in mitosis gene a)-related kinase
MEQSVTNPAESATEQNGPLIFGNYEAVKAIGKGKFAIVYRAHRIGDDQIVALKRISVDMMNDKAREKCLKEVRLLQSLDHPNIIHYMDSFITDNDLIIIYEWAAAGDLKRQIRKAQEKGVGFEERVIWKYFSQIANAIQHMHERRIMHRDLKPANIFLTLDGTIKVGDLGLSREFSEHTHQAHSKVGTPLYMSPEVIKGDGYEFKSDIWSLGCLLYELAVLKSPFKAEGINLYSLLHKISNGDYQPIPDHYSDELRNLAHAMISTNPEDRPDINYICEMAQRMRAQTAEKAGRLKRSYSRSEDLTDGVAEIKNDNRTAEIQGLVPSDSKPTFAENETKPPQRQRAPTDEFKLERRDSERSRIETREKERFEEQTFAVNNAQQFQVVIPFDDDPNYGKKSSKETSSEPAVYRRSKPPLPDTSKSGRPSSRVSRPSTVDDAPLKETNTNNFEEDFNSQGMPRKPSSSNLAAALENSSQAFAAMDVLYGKLVVLGYPMNDRKIALSSIPSSQRAKGRLLPIHFACNLQAFERIAGHEPNYQFVQFRRMAEVVIWLCQEKIGGKAADIANKIDTETSNSVTIAKQIVMAAQVTSISVRLARIHFSCSFCTGCGVFERRSRRGDPDIADSGIRVQRVHSFGAFGGLRSEGD